jgi:site-specific DNA-methyltransferase (adenine-specific)
MEERIKLMLGDNMKSLKELPDNSVDSIVTDPPYALTSIKKRFGKEGSAPAQFGSDGAFQRASKGFMGKEWDAEVPTVEFWSEVYRVLKPGGHVLSFGGTRTYHRMAVNIEDAGFEIRDQIMWIYGSGFPKSHNIGKAIDKIQGNEREVVGIEKSGKTSKAFNDYEYRVNDEIYSTSGEYDITKGNGDWEGWGTALKPANEPICLARKPLSEKTIAENVLKWGTGGLNIDASRISFVDESDKSYGIENKKQQNIYGGGNGLMRGEYNPNQEGRFPANVILDEEAGKILDEQSGIKQSQKRKPEYNKPTEHTNTYTPKASDYRDDNTYSDKGGASRFFYVPKVSKKERDRGLTGEGKKETMFGDINGVKQLGRATLPGNEHQPKEIQPKKNNHPTVKPINLLTYLVRLVTPKNGVVMDCFMGSGSTGIAAQLEGFKFIGMEMDEDYFNIAETRINAYEEYRELLK